MVGWYLYLTFVLVLGLMACVVLALKTHQYFPHKARVVCPETRSSAAIQLDSAHAVKSFFRNVEELRVKDCARWPERADCPQDCLLQIDPKPVILEHTLAKFYEGKTCARCNTVLTRDDWKNGGYAMLNEAGKYVPAAHIPLNRMPMALDGYRPLCRVCHQAEITGASSGTQVAS